MDVDEEGENQVKVPLRLSTDDGDVRIDDPGDKLRLKGVEPGDVLVRVNDVVTRSCLPDPVVST